VRFAAHFQITEAEFLETYAKPEGDVYVLRDRSGSYDCIFLKDNRCSVYEARPTQCRTFPWWSYHLNDKKDWEEAAKRCEGINHPDAPVIDALHIQEQCMTYLDNLLEQNFVIADE
jgi:Fe-S-cluster containining protein